MHNWDFRNPVNQRGLWEYGGPSGLMYTIDRWALILSGANSARLNVTDGGIILTNITGGWRTFFQVVEHSHLYAGLDLTFSVDVDSTIHSWTGNVGDISVDGYIIGFPTIPGTNWSPLIQKTNSQLRVVIRGTVAETCITLRRVKLELGTVSTLANDPPMDFGRELAVCQRFYEKSYSYSVSPGQESIQGMTTFRTNNAIGIHLFDFRYAVKKRISPTITVFSVDGTQGNVSGLTNPIDASSRNDIPILTQSAWRNDNNGAIAVVALAAHGAYAFHWTASADL